MFSQAVYVEMPWRYEGGRHENRELIPEEGTWQPGAPFRGSSFGHVASTKPCLRWCHPQSPDQVPQKGCCRAPVFVLA